MGLFGFSKKSDKDNIQYVTWKCRHCGRTAKTLVGYIPGSAVGGACRVVNGKAKPHEWVKQR